MYSKTVDENSKIEEPKTERPGFRFEGWYSGENKFYFESTQINTDYELVAVWTPLFIVDESGVLEPTAEGKALVDVVIPESIDGIKVSKIKDNAFKGCTQIVSVSIPNTVKTVGESAFEDCTGITSVLIKEDSILETIGANAFNYCKSITSFEIPASVTTIGGKAFFSCYGMEAVTFSPDSRLNTIGESAFSDCRGMTSFKIPASVTTIGKNAFESCTGLESITIPSGVTSVGQFAFQNCGIKDESGNAVSGLDTVTINSTSAKYGTGVFSGCCKLNFVEFPEDMNSAISNQMFYNCLSLEDTSIPSGVKKIGDKAFYGTKLTSIKIASDATVGDSAFPSTCTINHY